MRIDKSRILPFLAISVTLFACIYVAGSGKFHFFAPLLFAHCDTLGGPVIKAARKALETGNIDLVLIWVQKQDEDEIRKIFRKTIEVRKLNPEAQEFADMYFFETLVRIHRAGEGAPFTGLKPAGTEEPAIVAADKAVETGKVDALSNEISAHVIEGIKKHFDEMIEKKNMNRSVEAGRDYIASYVTFIHYVERLYLDAVSAVEHSAEVPKAETTHQH